MSNQATGKPTKSKQKVSALAEPPPTAVHSMARANGVRCVGPHFTNGKYTLHRGRGGYWPNVTGSEAMTILQRLQAI
jgi:hypothetical protein